MRKLCINYKVAALLQKLLIEFTKSRSRQSNDNALVESKNGSVIRKLFGYAHKGFMSFSCSGAHRYAQVFKALIDKVSIFRRKPISCYINQVSTSLKDTYV